MKMVSFAEAKKDFDRGLLVSARIERQPLSNDWCLFFVGRLRPDANLVLVGTREREVRVFKSLDAVLNMLRQIGFLADCLEVK